MFIKYFSLKNKNDNFFITNISLIPILIWFLIFGFPLLSEPYVWDDLHVFREYTNKQLIEVWFQNWFGNSGPDNIETPAYRPLAIWYYHIAYLIFDENVILFRLFVIFTMFLLIYIINKTLIDLNFDRKTIIVFTFLLIFSKIFTTLVAWLTITALIICYIFAFISINLFLRHETNKKFIFYFFSIFFGIVSILIREELYVLPGIIFFLYLFKFSITLKNFIKILIKTSPLSIFVVLHLILRKKFVPDADNFSIKDFSVYFGEKQLGLGYLIKVLKASFFPMGYPNFSEFDFLQYSFSIIWLCLIFFSIGYYFYKKKYSVKSNSSFILFLIAIICSLPHIAIPRAFGIFLPSVFVILIISRFISELNQLNVNSYINKVNFSKKLSIILVLIGVTGGIYRSYLHLKCMDKYSVHIVHYDSQYIYIHTESTIPLVRKQAKTAHLYQLNIFSYKKDFNEILNSSKLIQSTKYRPQSF